MNRFDRQWATLNEPLNASYEFVMTHGRAYYSGYIAFHRCYPVQLMSLYEALEYERYKNGRLRKKYHEMKQRCKSLKITISKLTDTRIRYSYLEGYYKCLDEIKESIEFYQKSYDGNDALCIMLSDIADKFKEANNERQTI